MIVNVGRSCVSSSRFRVSLCTPGAQMLSEPQARSPKPEARSLKTLSPKPNCFDSSEVEEEEPRGTLPEAPRPSHRASHRVGLRAAAVDCRSGFPDL